MGRPVRDGPILRGDVSNPYFSPTVDVLPSPASVTASLTSPCSNSVLSHTPSYFEQLTLRDGLPEADRVVPTEPDDIKVESVMTPPGDEALEPNMNTVVGGTLAPVSSASGQIPPRSDLRLPSFEALGIAAPHPDRSGRVDSDAIILGRAQDAVQLHRNVPVVGSEFSRQLDARVTDQNFGDDYSGSRHFNSIARDVQPSIHRFVGPLTPPAEGIDLDWNLAIKLHGAVMDSPSTDSGRIPTGANELPPPTVTAMAAVALGDAVEQPRNEGEFDNDDPAWINDALHEILANLRSATVPNCSVRVLSHALPSPSASGHVFSQVIAAINDSAPATPTSPTTWINVFHAIPGRFNLADIPTSPPSTPGPAVGGDDYFTQKVFDSAVSIADYQTDLSSLPRSPLPVVQPSSIDVSVVERYIPPSTSHEFVNMFNPSGPSILVDRLIELSPNNGSLLFIYPTRTGAQTFIREYLGPLLDPTLRTMVVVHDLSSELGVTLGGMPATDQLQDHESLHHRINTLCARLTQHSSSAERFHGRRPTFSVSYASKKYVKLQRAAWARDWWTKQEKTRIRDAVTKYSQDKQKKTGHDYGEGTVTSTDLVQKLLDGVAKKQSYHPGQEPEHGVEVSVFVIKRTE